MERRRGGHQPSDTTFKFLSIGVSGRPLRLLLRLLRFSMCRGRRTAVGPDPRLPLPTVVPAGFDEINDDIDALPDPSLLCAEERAAAMGTHRTVAEPHRGVSDRSGRCRRYRRDSRVLGAGTTGSLVAIATGSPVAVGSGMVNTANALMTCRS